MADNGFKMQVVGTLPTRTGHATHASPVIDPILAALGQNEGKWMLVDNRETATSAGGLAARLKMNDDVSAVTRRRTSDNGGEDTFDVYAAYNLPESERPVKRTRKPKAEAAA